MNTIGCPKQSFYVSSSLNFQSLKNPQLHSDNQSIQLLMTNVFPNCTTFQQKIALAPNKISFCTQTCQIDDPSSICCETQIRQIIQFFVDNYTIIRMKEVHRIREQYVACDEILGKVFDAIAAKYSSSRKPKEELVKWIIRKAFMTGKQNIKEGKKMSQKDLTTILCKRYSLVPKKEEYNNDMNGIDELLPYKKNSKCKTINKNFIHKMFTSQEFQEDYDSFLEHFDEIIQKDSIEKVDKFYSFVLECVKNGNIHEIGKFKRVPWLKAWAEKAKRIAIQIENDNIEKVMKKHAKLEFLSTLESQIKSES